MTSVSEIYSKSIHGSFQASAGMTRTLRDMCEKVDPAGQKRFQNQSQIVEANLSTAYGNLLEQAIWQKSCDFNITTAKKHNADQTQLIDDVKDIYKNVYNNAKSPNVNVTEMCDKALKDIQNIMNRQHANGCYILGGKNNALPCGDLTAVDNIVNGKVTTNYTKVISDSKNIPLSRLNNVTLDMDARNPVFANVIAAINSIKSDSPSQMAINNAADKSLELAVARNSSDKKKIDQAGENNTEDKGKDDIALQELTHVDLISAAGALKDLGLAFKMSTAADTEAIKLNRAFLDSMAGF